MTNRGKTWCTRKNWRLNRTEFKLHLDFPVWPWMPQLPWGENHSLPYQPAVTRFLPVPSPSPGVPPLHIHTLCLPFQQANCYPSSKTQLNWRHIQHYKHAFNNTGSFPLSPISPQLDKVFLLWSLLSLPAIVIR